MPARIIIFAPTETEIEVFKKSCPDVAVEICGVGMAQAAAAVALHARQSDGQMMILAGIAGAYAGSGLAKGDCVLVDTERVADLGAVRSGGFERLYKLDYHCHYAESVRGLKTVASNTVSAAGAGFANEQGAALENMEGAAFFAVCLRLGLPFLELRAISNMVGAPREEWDIDLAARQLADGLKRLLRTI